MIDNHPTPNFFYEDTVVVNSHLKRKVRKLGKGFHVVQVDLFFLVVDDLLKSHRASDLEPRAKVHIKKEFMVTTVLRHTLVSSSVVRAHRFVK